METKLIKSAPTVIISTCLFIREECNKIRECKRKLIKEVIFYILAHDSPQEYNDFRKLRNASYVCHV